MAEEVIRVHGSLATRPLETPAIRDYHPTRHHL